MVGPSSHSDRCVIQLTYLYYHKLGKIVNHSTIIMNTSLIDYLDISPDALEILKNGKEEKGGKWHEIVDSKRNAFPSASDIVNEFNSETGIGVSVLSNPSLCCLIYTFH